MAENPVIGHVHLKVSDLPRAVRFYREVLGMELQQMYGDEAAFLSFGDYHHHLGLNVWESKGGSRPPRNATGLYHFAILYPSRRALATAVKKVLENRIHVSAADHGVSEAVYFSDPDGNGIELYCDRPKDQWPRKSGRIDMTTLPLDLENLLAEAD